MGGGVEEGVGRNGGIPEVMKLCHKMELKIIRIKNKNKKDKQFRSLCHGKFTKGTASERH